MLGIMAAAPMSKHSFLNSRLVMHSYSRKRVVRGEVCLQEKFFFSIEIEKDNTIDQEGKPLDSTWRALFNVQN